jgi:CBS domain-containing protein
MLLSMGANRPEVVETVMTTTNTCVGAIMSTRLLLVEQNEKLTRADELMRSHRVRHVLAVDEDGALTGVVSQRDLFHGGLLKALGYGTRAKEVALDSLRVKDAMTAEPVTVSPQVTLSDAARIMLDRKLGCLPVLESGRLVGIITEGDFVRVAAGLASAPRAD